MTAFSKRAIQIAGCVWLAGAAAASEPVATAPSCRIEVVERGSGWPVPLVELRSVHNVRFVTDNAGVIAVDSPELMGREVWFTVNGNGYESPKDGFGFRGVRLVPGARQDAASRVGSHDDRAAVGADHRGGNFAESQRLGGDADWKESGVAGCDSVQNAVHRGRMFWLWGIPACCGIRWASSTARAATTPVQPLESFEPPIRLKYQYFTDAQGTRRGVAEMPGAGPTWVTGYASLPDRAGRERLVGLYAKIKPPLEAYRYGLCAWNDHAGKFEHLKDVWTKTEETRKPPPMPKAIRPSGTTRTARWVLFGDPLPAALPGHVRGMAGPGCVGSAPPAREPCSAADSSPVKPHSGSIAFSGVGASDGSRSSCSGFGKPSAFGELWYAEADRPTGPWARR